MSISDTTHRRYADPSHDTHLGQCNSAPGDDRLAEFYVCSQGRCDLNLGGTADVHTRLFEQVQQAYLLGARMILVDVDRLHKVTPSGIADLLHAVRFVRGRNADLRLHGHSPALTDALTALDLARVVAIYTDRGDAVEGRRAERPRTGRGFRRGRSGKRARFVGSN